MDTSSSQSPSSPQLDKVPFEREALGTTWGERLLMNLFSYSIILIPIAFVVLTSKYKICPSKLRNSTLIRWFVYGNAAPNSSLNRMENSEDNEKLLLEDGAEEDRRKLTNDNHRSRATLEFIWCLIGLQLSYLIWGVLQEKIMTTEYHLNESSQPQSSSIYKSANGQPQRTSIEGNNHTTSTSTFTFHDSQFLVFVNRIIAFVFSIIALVYNRPKRSQLSITSSRYVHYNHQVTSSKPSAPLYEYVYCSLSNILSSWCQYEALKYVNFPTQVLSKSCKIVPVMLMSRFMLRKRYQFLDYSCALLLSIGMFVFMVNQTNESGQMNLKSNNLTNSAGNSNSSYYGGQRMDTLKLSELSQHVRDTPLISGLMILALYLAFDSFTSNWQQSLFSRYGISNWQMMAATNFYSILLTLTSLHQLGTLKPAFDLLASSSSLLLDCLLMSIMSSIGQLFVYYTIKRFGSVIFAVIMTLRQFLAILLSCTIYGHRITFGSSIGLLMVFLVVGFQMWRRSPKKNSKEPTENSRIQFKALNK